MHGATIPERSEKKSHSVQQKLGMFLAAPCCLNQFLTDVRGLNKIAEAMGRANTNQSELKNQWIMQERNALLCEKASTLWLQAGSKTTMICHGLMTD